MGLSWGKTVGSLLSKDEVSFILSKEADGGGGRRQPGLADLSSTTLDDDFTTSLPVTLRFPDEGPPWSRLRDVLQRRSGPPLRRDVGLHPSTPLVGKLEVTWVVEAVEECFLPRGRFRQENSD